MNLLQRSFDDAFCLLYPRLCLACGEKHLPPKNIICVSCDFKLPETKFHLTKENEFTQKFWGRVNLEAAASYYFFYKKSKTQQLLHNLKYNGKKEIGVKLGRRLGKKIAKSPHFQEVDLIVPIPLHIKREIKRGYNQSAVFAQGLSETSNIPWSKDAMERKLHTETQTKKSRLDRFENVMKAFSVKRPELIKGKHILLVDDVLTTGATLEAAALRILEVEGTKVSMATIGFAKND